MPRRLSEKTKNTPKKPRRFAPRSRMGEIVKVRILSVRGKFAVAKRTA